LLESTCSHIPAKLADSPFAHGLTKYAFEPRKCAVGETADITTTSRSRQMQSSRSFDGLSAVCSWARPNAHHMCCWRDREQIADRPWAKTTDCRRFFTSCGNRPLNSSYLRMIKTPLSYYTTSLAWEIIHNIIQLCCIILFFHTVLLFNNVISVGV